ncbi:NUDIX domain containing protein, putative [Angomonas deanei]|uniref:NUDIX domain containing protein, putative n=1 Tax=Angomonas deanei TaxID=59799 RepID=A0A7G2C5T3_9TRYP|nr:NUDIX domain containing protein, putative [Angomonas deanei]
MSVRSAAVLPKSIGEWRALLQTALNYPIETVWFPEHFYLQRFGDKKLSFHPKSYAVKPTVGSGSAVLILLSPPSAGSEVPDLCITLTERSNKVSTHKGQMSFPGGRIDPGETPVEAATREAEEEVGLLPCSYDVLGQLTTIASDHKNAPLTPVVAFTPEVATPHIASPDEVESIQYLHLSSLLLHSAETQCRMIRYKTTFSSTVPHYFPCCFTSDTQSRPATFPVASPIEKVPDDQEWDPLLVRDFPGKVVWGLTSFMLCELVARIAKALEEKGECSATAILRSTNLVARDPARQDDSA